MHRFRVVDTETRLEFDIYVDPCGCDIADIESLFEALSDYEGLEITKETVNTIRLLTDELVDELDGVSLPATAAAIVNRLREMN